MNEIWITIPGVVVEGHRVASGPSKDYPYSSLERQKPFFQAGGLDLDRFFLGTLNISIAPRAWELVRPQYTFRGVAWTDLHPPEDFSFSPCRVHFEGKGYEGWVYYPHPETKIRNFQNPSLVEVIAAKIPGIRYGSRVEVTVNAEAIKVTPG